MTRLPLIFEKSGAVHVDWSHPVARARFEAALMVARRIRIAASDDEAHKLLEETFAYFSKSTYAGPSDLYLRIAAYLGLSVPGPK